MNQYDDIKALILDCDGVIVDSEPLSCKAWNVVFEREYNINIGTGYEKILGTNTRFAAEFYLKKNYLDVSENILSRLSELKEEAYIELADGRLRSIPSVERIIQQARSLDWKIAVASSGIKSKIQFSLKQVGLDGQFDALIGSDERLRGKPYPDIFLESASQIGINPDHCIALEDTPNGIQAAKEAGMYVIAITTTFLANKLENADLVISSFDELDLRTFV
ncbi:MAG: HAD family hydrolase [Candidatus Hodarchaeales archaeon]